MGVGNRGKEYTIAFMKWVEVTRKRRGFSQQELCRRLGVARSTYAYWRTGHCVPNISTYGDILETLGHSSDLSKGLTVPHRQCPLCTSKDAAIRELAQIATKANPQQVKRIQELAEFAAPS